MTPESNDLWWLQRSVGMWCKKQFPDQDAGAIALHFSEEAIELQAAVIAYMRHGPNPSTQSAIGEEIADCIILLLTLADHVGVVSSREVRKKMRENYKAKFALDESVGYHKRVKK